MIEKLLRFLGSRIAEYNGSAEEYFQELGNEEEGNKALAKAEALKEVIDYINSTE